jgi:hypothetical protein
MRVLGPAAGSAATIQEPSSFSFYARGVGEGPTDCDPAQECSASTCEAELCERYEDHAIDGVERG